MSKAMGKFQPKPTEERRDFRVNQFTSAAQHIPAPASLLRQQSGTLPTEFPRHQTDLAAQLSHSLRTPLNSIKGAAYHLKHAEELPRGEQEEFFDIIAGEVEKLISLVEMHLNTLKSDR